jgi:hypothetical protein
MTSSWRTAYAGKERHIIIKEKEKCGKQAGYRKKSS